MATMGATGVREDALWRDSQGARREAADVQKTSFAPRQQTQRPCATEPKVGQELAQNWPNGGFAHPWGPAKMGPPPYPTTHQIPNPTAAPITPNTPIPNPINAALLPNSLTANGVSDLTTAASGQTSAQQ